MTSLRKPLSYYSGTSPLKPALGECNMSLMEADVSTRHEDYGDIKVTIDVEVPDTLAEGIDFFGGEEKTVTVLQQEVKRRRVNAARPALRTASTELDEEGWTEMAQRIANGYAPGRKGFQGVDISTEDLAAVAGGSQEDLAAFLAARGVKIS